MRKMNRFFWGSLAAAFFFLTPLYFAFAQWGNNPTCPVMPGHKVKEKFYLDYQGERIFFCCRSCVKAFKKHPEDYLKNLEPSKPL